MMTTALMTARGVEMRGTARRIAVRTAALLLLATAALPALAGRAQADELVTELLLKLRDSEPAERAAASDALAEVAARDAERVLPALADALRDPVAKVRLHASEALLVAALADTRSAHAVAGLAPRLVERLTDVSPEVRAAAARALAAGYPHTPGVAADALVKRLDDPSVEVRKEALGALGGLASPGQRVVAALLRTLRDDPTPAVRGEAARALGGLQANENAVVTALIAALSDADPFVVRQAVRALGKLGPAAFAAAEELERIARDPEADAELRMHAVYALRSLGVPGVG
jgi:HEAT repeat protein